MRPDEVVGVQEIGDFGGNDGGHGPGGTVDVVVGLQSDANLLEEGVEGSGQEPED